MKKSEQIQVNAKVIEALDQLEHNELDKAQFVGVLRTCSACVLETPHFYVLRSYSTVVSCIDKYTGTLYDFLRYVYGYTATSQHIAKFCHDYGNGSHVRYTYKCIE